MREYSQSEALSFTPATRNELTHWTDTGIIVADIAEAGGRGRHRRFSFDNLVQICVAHELAAFHMAGVQLRDCLPIIPIALRQGAVLIRFNSDGRCHYASGGAGLDFGLTSRVAGLVINLQAITSNLVRKTGDTPPKVGTKKEAIRALLDWQRKQLADVERRARSKK